MDELVQDLVSALDDSSLKQDIDDQGDLSASNLKADRDMYRKRRMRKRRTTSTSSHLVSSLLNNLVVVNQINNSPRSSSSDAMKDYVESFTANCSDEASEECVNTWKSRLKNAVLSSGLQDRVHHKRVFKQARPCCCESDSHTENSTAIPVLRRHKKKKLKRMTIENSTLNLLHDSQGLTSGSCDEEKRRKQAKKTTPHTSEECKVTEKMYCNTTKLKKDRKTMISCLLCFRKSCDKLPNAISGGVVNGTDGDESQSDQKVNRKDEDVHHCQCTCHTTQVKDESSISGSSSNSDTDSANFTQDDIGGDGDDEMTDFYAESDSGPVWGIPHICELPWVRRVNGIRNSKDETTWSHKMDDLEISSNSYLFDARIKRFVQGTMHFPESARRGFHARYNRLPGMAARSIRRGRRRAKVKKAKEKSSKEQDFHSSLSKLSLSARSKRMRLDGLSSRQDWSLQKQFTPLLLPHSSVPKPFEINGKDKMDVPGENGEESESAKPNSSSAR